MKKKIFFAIAAGFFAVATVFNMNLLQADSSGDVSMEGIAVMEKAFAEPRLRDDVLNPLCPNGCLANGDGCYCNGWHECLREAGSN